MHFEANHVYCFDGSRLDIKLFRLTEHCHFNVIIRGKTKAITRKDLAKLLGYRSLGHFIYNFKLLGYRMFVDKTAKKSRDRILHPKHRKENKFIVFKFASNF